MLVGGKMGERPEFGRFICREGDKKIKVPAELVHLAIERLIVTWQGERKDGEKFADWAQRQVMERLADLITLAES